MMKRQGLVVFSRGQPRDSSPDSVPMDLCLWELCFSLVSPLWELCYSLASCQNASGESDVLLVLFSPFSPLLSLFVLSYPSPSFSHSLSLSLFLSLSFPLPFFSFSFSFPFLFALFFFFLRELLILFVRDDTADCNQLYLHWNKEKFSFFVHEFVYSDMNNFLVHSLEELSVFLLPRCPASDLRGY